MFKKIIILILFILSGLQQLIAQQASEEAALQEFKKISGLYNSIPHLSFDENYYYGKEATPGVYLDSLQGSFKFRGKDYWYSIDSTESVTAGGYTIVLFKEDKIMYLAKSASGSAFSNPVTMMDSLLRNNKELSLSLTETKKQTRLSIDFIPAKMYKRIEYYIDKQTGLLKKVKSVVKADQLYDPSVRDLLDNNDTYACVEVFYKNYSQAGFDESIFDINRYFKKEGETYLPTVAYASYKIFLGTANL